MGGQALADGLFSGLTGVVEQPVRGAMGGGLLGLASGVGKGLVGVVTKPVSGIAGFASKATEGLAREAKKLTPTAQKEADERERLLRVRQPRQIGSDGVLLAFARIPPLPPTPMSRIDDVAVCTDE